MWSRRTVLLTAAWGPLSAGPPAAVAAQATAAPAELPLLTAEMPVAAELRYTAQAARLDPQRDAPYRPGDSCRVCDLFRGQPLAATGPCRMFRAHRVDVGGWCAGFETRIAPAGGR